MDVGIIVLSHCKNPAQKSSLNFLNKVLRLEIPCLIPISTMIGAYHILTNYLKIKPENARLTLSNTLLFKKPIFLEDLNLKIARRALEFAEKYNFESWDGYLLALMEKKDLSVIYTLDIHDFSKVEWISAINPIDDMEYQAYQKWIKELS